MVDRLNLPKGKGEGEAEGEGEGDLQAKGETFLKVEMADKTLFKHQP